MKKTLIFAQLLCLLAWGQEFGSTNASRIQKQEIVPAVDEVNLYYLEKIQEKIISPNRLEKSQNQYKENPRNAGFAASFGSISTGGNKK